MIFGMHAVVRAAPNAQSPQVDGSHLYLIPSQTTGVQLTMHNVELRVVRNDDGSLSLAVNAQYRLQNEGASTTQVALRLAPERSGVTPIRAQGLVLMANGQALALDATQTGSLNSQVSIPPDSGATVILQYQLILLQADVIQVRYVPSVLNAWPGRPSLRVDIIVPNEIDSASWVQTQPEEWAYGSTADTGVVDIKWLYDGVLPNQAIMVEFLSPGLWSQMQSLSATANNAPTVSTFEQLGAIYRRLSANTQVDEVRNRFYAQAVAAYTAGLALAPSGGDNVVASLHIGLAALYRNRAASTSGNLALQYAKLMVKEAEAALDGMSPDDVRARELWQWLADGLRVQLEMEQAAHDWVAALEVVDQLSALPADTVDVAKLDLERKSLQIQQALQLMERGDRSGAEALAGSQIDDTQLLPPSDLVTIFSSWQVSVSAGLQATSLQVVVSADESRAERALAALTQVVQGWQSGMPNRQDSGENVQISLDEVEGMAESQRTWRITITEVDSTSANQLAMLMPGDANWALLRILLAQLAPQIELRRNLVRDQVQMSQPLDLRSAGDQWSAMAASLTRRADEFLTQSEGADSADPDVAAARLQAQIQAANYRNAAIEWRNLGRQSWVLFVFDAGEPALLSKDEASRQRSWYATVSTPSQMLVFQTQTLDVGRMVGLSMGSFLLIVMVAGTLWWLL